MSKLFEYDYNLNSGGKEYLDEIIPKDTYERMFRGKNISVLNKGRCGNGGTTGFVRYALEHNKGCLILVPNRSIVISKETNDYKDNKDVCCVYGGSGNIDRDARIVIATYDQFPRLLKTLSPGGFTRSEDIWSSEFWSGRTVIIDEYHKLVDECKFRDICHRITELIKTTDNGLVLLSATPHWGYVSLLRELVEDREVITYNINYEEERRRLIEVYDVKTRDLHSILKKMKESPKNNHVCVFYNSVTGIERVIDHIGGDDCEILCGDSNKKKLGDYYSETFHDDKKLHFMTSAFFAGQDIKTPVKQCVIIGSRESENMCVGERDIKQIVGRFREGVDGVHIFYLNRKTDMDRYQTIKSEYDKNNQCLDMMGENWKMRPATIEMRQENIRLKDTLERFDYWSSKRTLIKRLEDYGYVIKDRQVGEFDEVGKRKKLTFNDAKHKIAVGENITYDDNKYCHMIKEFMMEKGVDEMLSASRETITDWYRIRNSVGISELDLLSPDEKFRLLGLENFGKYRGSYLMSCLKYLGVTCDYDQIPYKMREELGCYTTIWKRDPKGKESSDVYMVYTKMKEWRTPPKMGMCSYKEETFDIPNSGGKSHRLSYQTEIKNKKCYGKTTSLKDAPSHYNLLKGNYLYDWVNKDKEHRLPGVKGEDRWKDIKNYEQTKISELYKDTDSEYYHTKGSMDSVDCLIVDIDSGITFSDFQERYHDYIWVAYPTINNIPDDWKKFRVIVPLRKTLRLCGEYNVMTLKMLRSMFCYYEDPNHQVTSYINLDDWLKMRGNNGEMYDIPQEIVDDIMRSIQTHKDLMSMEKFDKERTDKNIKGFKWKERSLEWAQDYFKSSFDLGDGERHKRLFVIKNSLGETDRDKFQTWLRREYPRYMDKWKSHKVVRRGN